MSVVRGSLPGQPAMVLGDRQELDRYSAADLLRTYGVCEIGRFELPHEDDADRSRERQAPVLDAVIHAAQKNKAQIVLLGLRANAARQHCLRTFPRATLLPPDQSDPVTSTVSAGACKLQLHAPLTSLERAVKRSLDVLIAATMLLLLSPLLLLVSIAIKLSSPGPVIFRQHRNGLNGRQFTIYKFRSMTVMENGATIRQAQINDKRVTRLGSILRSSSIDELPQLVNVLRGDMSLVGPRPHALAHDRQYSKTITNYALRQRVKPGITGWAQVSGARGETARLETMERRVNLDLWYINNWSVWLDMRILLRTCVVIHRSPNAY